MTSDCGPGSLPALALLLVAGCARGATVPPPAAPSPGARTPAESLTAKPQLPAMQPVRGPLALHVTYPPPDAVLQVRDSSFLFGTAGTRLSENATSSAVKSEPSANLTPRRSVNCAP